MENVPMSTSTLSFSDIKGSLHQIGGHLFLSPAQLLPEHQPSAEQAYLERVNSLLKTHYQTLLGKSRKLYETLPGTDLYSTQGQALVDTLKRSLNAELLDMGLREPINGASRKSFLIEAAGLMALEYEARLGVQDRLLHPQDSAMLAQVRSGPSLRPGLYALRFGYQDKTIELAGAFVATQKNSPIVTSLTATEAVGRVLLFTPVRGIEAFDSLSELNDRLLQILNHPTSRHEFMTLLPKRYHTLTAAGIWPLALASINEKPLFEHLFDTQVDKRTQDIDYALSFADNPSRDPAQLHSALDTAITTTPPDFSARLELRAQALLERHLRLSAPDWYRSASETRRAELAEHLGQYNQARQALLDLLGPAATPHALAAHQWRERLSDELEIDDLQPEHLLVTTQRVMTGLGPYEQQRNLIDLALRGLHTGDELPGSDFVQKTTLTYHGAALPDTYRDLTPTWLAKQLSTLQPRIDFAQVQQDLHGRVELKQAIEQMLDRRINALAYTAVLQNHLSDDDFQLIQRLRAGSDPQLSAASLGSGALSLHGAQLLDLWALRQADSTGTIKRVLLCTPQAPRAQQFMAFDSEAQCQAHILGWAVDNGVEAASGSLTDYLITRLPMRFRGTMNTVLAGLGFKPHSQEHQEVSFNTAPSYQACLQSMAEHALRTRVDDYDFSTPPWFRSASTEQRRTLLTLNENADNTLQVYNAQAFSEASFPSFDSYVHQQARLRLNRLLGRSQNDVDPDSVWAYSPPALIGAWTPAPQTYTQLYRDGYADGVGFIDEKFSHSARFRGPQGIDLTPLTAQTVARSITGVWVGERYIDKVRGELLNSREPSYDIRRRTVLAITQWQLQSAALESQLQGHIAEVDRQWLDLCIAGMGDTSVQARTRYTMHRLMIDGDWVIGAWLFTHADNPVLLYTPQAPDGISFREARLFNYLLKKQPGMIAYLTERVGVQSRTRVRNFLEEARRKLPEQLDKTSISPARYDTTQRVAPITDLRQALYNMKLQRKIDDVAATTVSRTQMITGILWTCVEWVAAVATAPFPVLSLSVGLLLAFKDAMLALHAYNQGDTSAAFEHFLGYLFNSAGALFTDLRPALRALNPVTKPLRLSAADAGQSRALQLINQLEAASPAPQGMQPVIFDGQALWAPKTPDALGRYLLYRLDPAAGQLVSTARLAEPNVDGVWVRSGLAGGAPKYESLPETPGPHKDYGVPAKYWRDVELVLNPQMKPDMILWADVAQIPAQMQLDNTAMKLRPARGIYQQQVMRLASDAQAFFQTFVPLPAVAKVPAVDASASFAELIGTQAFTGNKHLLVGALPGSIAGKQVLIDNMDALIEKGFNTLYLEYLPGDVFRVKLQKLNSGESWRHIRKHLSTVDKALGFASDAQYSYLALVSKARAKGLQVRALDASTSYQLDSALILGDEPPTTPRNNRLRNFYSHKAIEADMADTPQERWVALVEPSRLRTFEQTPGLADLQDAVALRIEDVGTDQPMGIRIDTPGSIPGDAQAQGDYLMTLPSAYKVAEPAAPAVSAPTPVAEHFSNFDIAPAFRDDIVQLAQEPHGLDSRYGLVTTSRMPAFNAFIDTRSRLRSSAETFFANYVPPIRPTLPVVTAATTPQAFIKQVSDSRLSGLVIGEGHAHEASKTLLRTQMKTFKEAGFKTLYVEHLLTDLHQTELDLFQRTQRVPGRLKAYLKGQDEGHMWPYSGPDTYTQVIQAANKYGMRVRALDCTASYHVKGLSVANPSRNQMFSYFATRVIEADQAAQGAHKWIAFVGSAHTNINEGVPGLAEMLGAVSLHVRDTAPALARGIHPGYWESDLGSLTSVALRSDFKLDVGKAGRPLPIAFVAIERSKLTHAGHYLIERPSTTETRLVHHSQTGEIVTTPIQVDDNGMFFIDRWGKQAKRFKHLFTLLKMLESEVNLIAVK
jgi:hypothetical protein